MSNNTHHVYKEPPLIHSVKHKRRPRTYDTQGLWVTSTMFLFAVLTLAITLFAEIDGLATNDRLICAILASFACSGCFSLLALEIKERDR